MLKRLLSVLLLAAVFANVAYASDRAKEARGADYERTGRIDAVYLEENRIVIDDVPYGLADYLRIHASGTKVVPRSRLRSGITVGFKAGRGRLISEIWLLPGNTERRGRR